MSIIKSVVATITGYKAINRQHIEDHLTYIRNDVSTQVLPISEEQRHKYDGDFYGLLKSLGVEQRWWWVQMRVNGFNQPFEFTKQHQTLLIADSGLLINLS